MKSVQKIIKFSVELNRRPSVDPVQVRLLRGWRNILWRLGVIGSSPARYHGLGYGNISIRHPDEPSSFIISGSQTGAVAELSADDFVVVDDYEVATNWVRARGLINPSSEALTHAQVYHCLSWAGAVIHGHCPEIWRHGDEIGLPSTAPTADYGSVALAEEIAELCGCLPEGSSGLFTMAGHEDGVISLGPDISGAALVLLDALARAYGVPR
jgi:L-ribulose-5-phosphate 4-epimerase